MRPRLKSSFRLVQLCDSGPDIVHTIPEGDISKVKYIQIKYPCQIITLKRSSNHTFFDPKNVEKISGIHFPRTDSMRTPKDIATIYGDQFNFNANRDSIIEQNPDGKWEQIPLFQVLEYTA